MCAIEDRTPNPFLYDSQGQVVKGQFDPGFENWCAENKKDPRQVAGLLFYGFPQDVRVLAEAQDSRAAELLRRGLQSTNTSVIMYSVQGLGRLHDSTTIPLIQKACERTPAARLVIAMQLPWFGMEADRLLEDLVPEPILRNGLKRQVYYQQLIELNVQRSRAGLEAIPIPNPNK